SKSTPPLIPMFPSVSVMSPAANGRASAFSSASTREAAASCSRCASWRSSVRVTWMLTSQTKKRTKIPKRHAMRSPKAGQIGASFSLSLCGIALFLLAHGSLAAERAELGEQLALEAELPVEELLRVREVAGERLGRGALARLDDGGLELAEALEPRLRALAVVLDGHAEALRDGRELGADHGEGGRRVG